MAGLGALFPAQGEAPKQAEPDPLVGNLVRNQAYAAEGPYQTFLPPSDEKEFRSWVKENKVPFRPDSAVQDYDMRGFWKALKSGDERAKSAVNPNDKALHYPDYWKTPYHETFSAESQWAKPNAPRWVDDRYLVDAGGRILFDDQAPRRR